MKKILIILFTITLAISGEAQTVETNIAESLYNGYLILQANETKQVILSLPYKSQFWHYAFNAARQKNELQEINLLQQVSEIANKNALLQLTEINIPVGNALCSVYLTDLIGATNSKSGSYFQYSSGNSFLNRTSGKAYISKTNTSENVILIKNTNPFPVYVKIEAVNVSKEKKIIETTAEEQKAILMGNMGWKYYKQGELDKAIDFTTKSIESFPLGWVYGNLGLFRLEKGLTVDAFDAYTSAISLFNKGDDANKNYTAAIKDLEDLKEAKTNIDGIEEVISLLKSEKSKLFLKEFSK